MTQQESEDRVLPQRQRKLFPTREVEPREGGKAVPVEEAESRQLLLFATAESPRSERGAEAAAAVDRSTEATNEAPKAKNKPLQANPATVSEVIERLAIALEAVEANHGAPGPDRQTVEQVRKHWPTICRTLASALAAGTYQPGDIRRVWIPKAGGGQRGLGIPNVIDRVVQEAVRLVLEPLYEPTFHPSSHGFRPNRSCHTAIAEARRYVAEGYEWVVDIDLKTFFDRVHHQRLMARLATRVHDKPLLALIGKMLKAKVVLPHGVRVATEEGVPQGGPLSPLLSNIVLSELDDELTRRKLRFVRYADDSNIYVRSERAGQRVMESITRFIETRLRLEVNAAKSAVARPETRHFLGFRLGPCQGEPPEVLLSERSHKRLRTQIRELTPRSSGESLLATIRRINAYFTGWTGFFGICTPGIERDLRGADAHIRRRLRAIVLHHWRRKRSVVRRLIRSGIRPQSAWRAVYDGRRSLWALSHSPQVDQAMRNAYFAERGLVSLVERFGRIWTEPVAPRQLDLPWDTQRS
jgi:RNA-directed DNA polymerase